jgi:YidC/Oxa1 family membrane protein insertase
MSALLVLPTEAAYHLVSLLAVLFAPLPGGLAGAAAIVAFTIAVRLLVLPLSYYSFRGELARARLAPRIQELYRRHSGQPERLQRELASLKQSEGAGMLAGCLPALLQWPFFMIVYRLFLDHVVAGHPNLLLQQHLLGVPLGSHWLAAAPWSGHGLVFAGLFLLLALAGAVSARAARRWGAGGHGTAGAGSTAAGTARAVELITRLLPYATLVIAAFVPLAAGLYLLTTTAWTVAERAVLRRLMPSPGPVPATSGSRDRRGSRAADAA